MVLLMFQGLASVLAKELLNGQQGTQQLRPLLGCESQESHVIHNHGYNMVTTYISWLFLPPCCSRAFSKSFSP